MYGPRLGEIGPLHTSPGWIVARIESPQRLQNIYPLHEPGLSLWTSIWLTTRLTRVSLSTGENLKIGVIKVTKNLQNPVWQNGGAL